jgi:hypothetical protein
MMMPPPPGMRPTHRVNQASMQLAAAGIHPPTHLAGPGMPGGPGGPMTPIGGHFSRQSISGGPPTAGLAPGPSGHHPFPGRSRRQPSIGGPPKAVLGGPARKLSPLPGPTGTGTSTPTAPPAPAASAAVSGKKRVVCLPKETGEDGVRKEWARNPLPHPENDLEVEWPEEIASGVEYPPEEVRLHMPGTIDVFLPRHVRFVFSDMLDDQ